MPSKEDICLLLKEKSSPNTKQTMLARDIDDLVFEIKENLRLKAKPANLLDSSTKPKKQRASPYSVPSRTESKCGCCDSRRCARRLTSSNNTNTSNTSRKSSDDPYEMLQHLLRDGDLIKEAVNRLEMGLAPARRCVYYDSDEEFRTPPFPFDDIEV